MGRWSKQLNRQGHFTDVSSQSTATVKVDMATTTIAIAGLRDDEEKLLTKPNYKIILDRNIVLERISCYRTTPFVWTFPK